MKTKILSFLAATALFTGASAQNSSSGTTAVATPASPAPAISLSPSVANAPQVAPSVETETPAPVAPTGPIQAGITQIVHTPRLPSVSDLTNAAAAQGFTVERVVQTATQVIAFYRNAGGQATTVAYQTLPPTGIAPAAPAAPVVVSVPPPVVYESAPRVVYYESPGYYYPRVWYPPISFSVGFGYRGGYYHGGFRPGGHRRGR